MSTIIYQTRTHWKIFILPAILGFISGIIYFNQNQNYEGFGILVFIVSIIAIINALIKYYGIKLIIFEDKLEFSLGILGLNETSVPIEDCEVIHVRQSLFDRILNSGTLQYGNGSAAITFTNILNPKKFKENLYIQKDKYRKSFNKNGAQEIHKNFTSDSSTYSKDPFKDSKLNDTSVSRIVRTSIGEYKILNNGTVIDVYNKLQWMRAPLGYRCTEDGTFEGQEILYTYEDAVKLFGKGADIKGHVENGHRHEYMRPENLTSITDNYKIIGGQEKYEFAGFNDWRLPTCLEVHNSLHFKLFEHFDKWPGFDNSNFHPREKLISQIFNENFVFRSYWSADFWDVLPNTMFYNLVKGVYQALDKSIGGIAWKYDLFGTISDDGVDIKYPVILVRKL